MAEQRKKTHSILLTINSKIVSVELYQAEQWPDENPGEGLFRVRIDGRWYCPMGKYSFLTMHSISALAANILNGGEPAEPEEKPHWLEKGRRVRVHSGECVEGIPTETHQGLVVAPPHIGADGRWWVWVHIFGGTILVPCSDVEPRGR